MTRDSYIESLLACNPLRETILRAMIKALNLPKGSSGLDAGCGIGLQTLLLAKQVGTTGHVIGLDVSAKMLDYGGELVKEAGLSERISFKEGDITKLPFANNAFDWVISIDCVGYRPETISFLSEIVRVTKPGGIVAIAAWSSEKLLPGYPGLEARLGSTSDGIAPFTEGQKPELHFHRTLGWFNEFGLKGSNAKVFADSVHAPLNDKTKNALKELIKQRWPDVADELSPDDLAEFQRLCLPGSPDFILSLPDYYAFFTYTMFWGTVL
jgi:ubiquinone/menaquinone biosynthesis C-methylase UbiE